MTQVTNPSHRNAKQPSCWTRLRPLTAVTVASPNQQDQGLLSKTTRGGVGVKPFYPGAQRAPPGALPIAQLYYSKWRLSSREAVKTRRQSRAWVPSLRRASGSSTATQVAWRSRKDLSMNTHISSRLARPVALFLLITSMLLLSLNQVAWAPPIQSPSGQTVP